MPRARAALDAWHKERGANHDSCPGLHGYGGHYLVVCPMTRCSYCHSPIQPDVDICPCGNVANRDKRKRKHGKNGKVRLRQYGRGETPEGRYLSYTLNGQTIRLESRKADYLRIQGMRRGVFMVVRHGSPAQLLYAADIASKARAAFQAFRLEMLAHEARGFLKRAYLSKSNKFRRVAGLEQVATK